MSLAYNKSCRFFSCQKEGTGEPNSHKCHHAKICYRDIPDTWGTQNHLTGNPAIALKEKYDWWIDKKGKGLNRINQLALSPRHSQHFNKIAKKKTNNCPDDHTCPESHFGWCKQLQNKSARGTKCNRDTNNAAFSFTDWHD